MSGALVTGAGRGLGLEIARRLALRGHTVCVSDLDAGAARSAADQIGLGAYPCALDVRDAGACLAAARDVAGRAGSLGVWVNNAGLLRAGPAWAQSDDERRLLVDINAIGPMNGTIAALELMRTAGTGHVLNVVSLAGLVAAPGQTLYAATKHATIAFSVGTHFDLRTAGLERVHVSALCPSGIWTPMLHELVDDPEYASSFGSRLLDPAEVADRAMAIIDRPRPVVTMPRGRGLAARLFDAFPGPATALLPLVVADARRRQRDTARELARMTTV